MNILEDLKKLKDKYIRFSVRIYDETIKGDYHKKTILASWGKTKVEANKIINNYIEQEKLDRKNLTIEINRGQRDIPAKEITKIIKKYKKVPISSVPGKGGGQ